MFWAENGYKLPYLLGRLNHYWKDSNFTKPWFKPSALLEDCVANNSSIAKQFKKIGKSKL